MQAGQTADPKRRPGRACRATSPARFLDKAETKVRIEVTQTHWREWSEQSNFVQPNDTPLGVPFHLARSVNPIPP